MIKFVNHNGEPFLVAHFQGSSMYEYYPAIMKFEEEKVSVPANVSVVAFASKYVDINAMLLKQLRRNGVPYINPVSDVYNWRNPMRIKYMAELDRLHDNDFTLMLDASDVLLTGPLDDIVARFGEDDKLVMFGATKSNHPPVWIDKIPDRDWFGDFRYLNAGTVFGRSEDVMKFYRRANEIASTLANPYDSEQYIIRHALAEDVHRIGFDYKCRIFQTFGKTFVVQAGDVVTIS